MAFRSRALAIILVGAIAASDVAGRSVHAVEPLEHAHAHNDYWHERPLYDALDHGFASVEADVILVDGSLLVGHERDELKPKRTLESLYLAPLARRVRQNGGHVYQNGQRFFLLIDIKSDPQATYQHLQKVLSQYADMLTVADRDNVRRGAVTIVITGNRPRIEPAEAARRYAGLDGRMSDLDSDMPSHLMPMISDHWPSHFTWNGDGPMPAVEKAKLEETVTKAHAAGRVVRFWATPENESVWRELRSAGVDLVGTDHLDRLAAFLRAFDGEATSR
ncbi:MAG: phosphatidylinositol-specific phospholipase C/glycerophosphodiester phosphodiesterase family protein [Pirellulales bacterium]